MAVSPEAISETTTTWALDPAHTLVEFAAKHMVFTTVKGRFSGVSGAIVENKADHTLSSVDVEIDAATLDTRESRRDDHLRSADFLDVENYPTISFKSTRIEKIGEGHLRVVGNLTIRGTTREVALDTTLNGEADSPFGTHVGSFTAETSINRKDFGLNWNVALEAGGFMVGDTVKIAIETEGVRQG